MRLKVYNEITKQNGLLGSREKNNTYWYLTISQEIYSMCLMEEIPPPLI